jgi:hypothetical protein
MRASRTPAIPVSPPAVPAIPLGIPIFPPAIPKQHKLLTVYPQEVREKRHFAVFPLLFPLSPPRFPSIERRNRELRG